MEVSVEPSPGGTSIVANFTVLHEPESGGSSPAPTATEQKSSFISVDLTSKEHFPSSPSSPPEKISVTLEPVTSPPVSRAQTTKTPESTRSDLSSKHSVEEHSPQTQKSVFTEPASHKPHDRPKRGGAGGSGHRIILETPPGTAPFTFKPREGVKMYKEDDLYALSERNSANAVPRDLSAIHSIFLGDSPRMTGEERKEACRKILGAYSRTRPPRRAYDNEGGIESEHQPSQQRSRLVKVGGEWVDRSKLEATRRQQQHAEASSPQMEGAACPADQGAVDLVLGPPRRVFPSSQANGGRRKSSTTEGGEQAEQQTITTKRPSRGAAVPTQKAGPPTDKAHLVPFGRGTRMPKGEQKLDVNKLMESAAALAHPEHATSLDALESAAFATATPSPTLHPTTLTDLETSLTGSAPPPSKSTPLEALFSSATTARASETAPPRSVEQKVSVGGKPGVTPESIALSTSALDTALEEDEIFNSNLFKNPKKWLEEEPDEIEEEKPLSRGFARWFSAKEQQESQERQRKQSPHVLPSQPPMVPPPSAATALPPSLQSLFGAASSKPAVEMVPQPTAAVAAGTKPFSFEEFAKTVSALPTPSPAQPQQQRPTVPSGAPAPPKSINVSMLFAASAGNVATPHAAPPSAPSTADEIERQLLASSAPQLPKPPQLSPANAMLTSLFRSSAQPPLPPAQPSQPEMPGVLANLFQQQQAGVSLPPPLAVKDQPHPMMKQQMPPVASPKKPTSTATAQLMSLFASSQPHEPLAPPVPRQEPPAHPFLGRPAPPPPMHPDFPTDHPFVAELMRAQSQRMAPPPPPTQQPFMRSPPPFGGFFPGQPPRGMPPGVFPGGPGAQPMVPPGLERLFAMNPHMGYPPMPQQFAQQHPQRGGMSVEDLERQFSGPR